MKNYKNSICSIVIILMSLLFMHNVSLVFSLDNQATSESIPIEQVRQNDSNGVPLLLDSMVEIEGEVTVSDQFGIIASIQDETAGVMIYDSYFASQVKIGDYVRIRGKVTQYRGLTEISGVTILEHIPGTPSIAPEKVTCFEIENEGINGLEHYEGELLRIDSVNVNTSQWYVTGSGTNYMLSDQTGSCEVRIDVDANLANTAVPGGAFSIIGVLSQYDYSEPYTSGYQIMPRFIEDIVTAGGPKLVNAPIESDINPHSITISWESASPAQSVIMYGATDQFEIDTLRFFENKTMHSVTLTDLTPATFYHVKAGAADANGETFFDDHLVITASNPESSGQMYVYFNRDIDVTVALPGNEALSNQNLADRFIERVQSANYSIDICFYSWNLTNVTDALIDAINRGVRVRFIYENSASFTSEIERLRNLRIQVIDDAYGNNSGEGLQHNKFAIFDARDHSSASDDWVWTGSFNMTNTNEGGLYASQNAIVIQDESLARAFTYEFNEMWGSSNDAPNSSNARFSARKLDDAPHIYNVNGKRLEMYHSPSDPMINRMIDIVSSAQYQIYFCSMVFTRYDLSNAMYDQRAMNPGLQLSGVFGSGQDQYSQYFPMIGEGDYAWDQPADVWLEKESGQLHHKYMIVDPDHPDSQPIVIMGSANWTNSAVERNDENIVIIYDSHIANQYLQEFSARYEAASGRKVSVKQVETEYSLPDEDFRLLQNYPNPFNASTNIQFTVKNPSRVSLHVIDVTGRTIDTLVDGLINTGSHVITYTPTTLPSGVYICRLKVNGLCSMRKMILLK